MKLLPINKTRDNIPSLKRTVHTTFRVLFLQISREVLLQNVRQHNREEEQQDDDEDCRVDDRQPVNVGGHQAGLRYGTTQDVTKLSTTRKCSMCKEGIK